MTLPPRAVLVHRRTELDELVERHATRGQAAFFLATRGRSIDDAEQRDRAIKAAIGAVSAAIPADWRRGAVERADLPRWSFDPGDIVVVVGQDGLVANVARYLDGQLVIGINPEPRRNPGVTRTEGIFGYGESVELTAESDRLVAFGDGLESDSVAVSWGQRVSIGFSARTLRLVT